jgi:hypothetical protein
LPRLPCGKGWWSGMQTVLVCNLCQARVWLDGNGPAALATVMRFCAEHRAHAEGVGFSLLLPMSELTTGRTQMIALLPAGVCRELPDLASIHRAS